MLILVGITAYILNIFHVCKFHVIHLDTSECMCLVGDFNEFKQTLSINMLQTLHVKPIGMHN